jgi:hypothetical protein
MRFDRCFAIVLPVFDPCFCRCFAVFCLRVSGPKATLLAAFLAHPGARPFLPEDMRYPADSE